MAESWQWFRFTNWRRFPSDWVRAVDALAGQIAAETARLGVGMKRFEGSYSFIRHGKVVGKLAPRNPEVCELMVGFSATVAGHEAFAMQLGPWGRYLLGPSKEKFVMVACDRSFNAAAICRAMTGFLSEACHS